MKKSEAKRIVGDAEIGLVVNTLIGVGAYRVTEYVSPSVVIRATRRYGKRRVDRRSKSVDIVLCVGRPNAVEKSRIKRGYTGTHITMPKEQRHGR